MNISNEHIEHLQKLFKKFLVIKETRIISNPLEEYYSGKIVVPSKMFPLVGDGEVRVFSKFNTEKLVDTQVADIFDSTLNKLGNCYSNTKRLYNNLIAANIIDIKPLVGWFYMTLDDIPVHHCCLLYKDKYILDYASDNGLDEVEEYEKLPEYKNLSQDELRKILAERYVKRQREFKPSERTCFGYVDKRNLYIAKECDPQEGANFFFSDLMKTYPQHVSCSNVNKGTGATATQKIITEMKN